ncbi:NAD(P)H nitroreductase [Acrocarpospora phusangensis]|uniref:NAD(P)H nitroreductase n=1 Tax=Acrocarpospora phusangensis TaxID=1070424 RepID=A0A919UH84_9ACTN|nr:nitroreductase family protein [Acrocarpospora phusangensis]GIH21754.1 NAD(P)H nitroreductase [Acrocarpospora phusangensis]
MGRCTRDDLEAVVEAAAWAPSVHNSQPWSFALDEDEIILRADTDRRLRAADPEGRELLLSCGAALFNVRTAIRATGCEPLVRMLPDPDRPALVARVRIGPAGAVEEETKMLREEIPRRRTHRAGFIPRPVPPRLLDLLVKEAEREGARLTPVRSVGAVRVLAALTSAAQDVQAQDRSFSLEMIRWGRPPGSRHRDGVPADAYPQQARRTYPHFAQRDYARGQGWGDRGDQPMATQTGVVALLTTGGDTRADWIQAGQALQAVLLHASAYGVCAAFHTQLLEFRHLRDFVREELCSPEFPQMVMRLGYPVRHTRGVRRTLPDVLEQA